MVPTHVHPGTARRDEVSRPTRLSAKHFPVADRAFAHAVECLLDEMAGFEVAEPRALEARLRAAYPDVRIVARQAVLAGGGVDEVWYVFRDGTPAPAPLEFE